MKTTPFWWEEAEPTHGERTFDQTRCDVLIVGSGYAGINAAITLAEAGVKDIFVVDAMRIGEGASSRNGGQIGRNSPKFSLAEGIKRFGEQRAREIIEDYDRSFDFMLDRAKTLTDDFDLNLTGGLVGAHSRNDYEALSVSVAALPAERRAQSRMIPEAEMKQYLRTDIYRGLMLRAEGGSVHPAKYIRALVNRARTLGVRVFSGWRYLGATDQAGRKIATLQDVTSSKSVTINAGKVLAAVNGYTGKEVPWLRQRTIPVQSYMIATEQLPLEQMEELIPHNRTVGDTKHILYYFRRSPDGTRILFGGRARFRTSTEEQGAVGLLKFLLHTFPSLEKVKLSHGWYGNVCFAYDFCSHVGRMPDGVYYISCCNGGGVSMMTYLGHRCAEMMMDVPDHDRGIVNSRFPQLYFYNGHPWFLPAVGTYYRFLDRAARWGE
ncbi:NAD(P)/FAD-dependent oxidoreductase [Mycoplana dimorpha]|uniref:Glycine/D-amino acid oxidase-like deaminating enzyme n=1 Tax=Mycoplana dimorpha TaxID=28320 RepID=A0A2T5AQY6_MYCDI|nr:FAD-binding oxidoreductase [Mycoplana dimorpha]PTM89151.1 glycine/D-amino acid oxidase-like deaminating enzyme [Mycoplana dimorpha]